MDLKYSNPSSGTAVPPTQCLPRKLLTLSGLFSTLPEALPNVGGPIDAFLDPEDIRELGHSGALNRCFHGLWGYKTEGLTISERGQKLTTTINIIQQVLTSTEDLAIVESWVDALTEAAYKAHASDTIHTGRDILLVDEHLTAPTADTTDASDIPKVDKPVVFSVPKMKQTTLGFRKLTPDEAAEQNQREMAELREESARIRAKEAMQKAKEEEERKAYERERKAWYRYRKRKDLLPHPPHPLEAVPSKPPPGSSSNPIELPHMEKASPEVVPTTPESPDAPQEAGPSKQPELSQKQQNAHASVTDKTLARRAKDACKTGTTKDGFRTNWQNHWTWQDILDAQKKVGWSANDIVQYLWKFRPSWYCPKDGERGGLHRGTVAKWIESDGTGGHRWKANVLKRASEGRIGATKRSNVLSDYPEVVKAINTQLESIRLVGGCVQRPLVSAVIRSHINHSAPHIFDKGFKLSDSWVHNYISGVLNWSMRKSTNAARKVPANANDLCRAMHARIALVCRLYNIKPDLIVNADQTGISLFPTGKYTYELKGSKDVSIVGHEEKRQTTVVVASSMSGNMLPFQSVWGGKTAESLPSTQAARRAEADTLGFKYAHGDTRHWSSRETTKAWITEILLPYFKRKGMEETDHALLLIDVWPVHIAKGSLDDFLPWMKQNYPRIIILFVPGGCTGLVQPADVGLQRLLKHQIKRSATDFVVATATRQLASGKKPADIKLPTDLPTLRNASIAWLLDAFKYFDQNPEVVRKAWVQCKISTPDHGILDLSYDSITSSSSVSHSTRLFATDSVLRTELARFQFSTISGEPEDPSDMMDPSSGLDHDDDLSADVVDIVAHCSDVQDAPEVIVSDPIAETDFLPNGTAAPPPGFHPHAAIPNPFPTPSAPSSDVPVLPQARVPAARADPASVFLLDIAVQGGTNYAATQTAEQGRITDRAARKPRTKKAAKCATTGDVPVSNKTAPGESSSGTGTSRKTRAAGAVSKPPRARPRGRKRAAVAEGEADAQGGRPPAKKSRTKN
ncbi:hypothetical protein VTO73DRAFT_2825 [Trametes versicolor]